tara:strand:+ start:5906 stop:6295 length:390 start_codon:yes stop_codon:yes gene_type:complete
MKLVKNSHEYYEFIRNLRNHQSVKKGFINQEHIDLQRHTDHMKKYSECYYICLIGDEPAGYVGQIDDDIRVATFPAYQGKGVGSFMINELMKIRPSAMAKVKIENHASLKLFEKCGFEKKYYILEKEIG